jgi:ATP-dependent HslUV protease subunit HslV
MIRSTTVICVRKDGKVVMAGDGQVTLGETVIKQTARKIRRLYNGQILAGFADQRTRLPCSGSSKLEGFRGNLSAPLWEQQVAHRPGRSISKRCSWWQTEVHSC